MKNTFLILLVTLMLVIIQNCATVDKTAKEKNQAETAVVDEELLKDVQELKAILGYSPTDLSALDKKKLEQPVAFGMSVKQVQEIFPAPDKFEYDPMVNRKVTMLARDASGGRFTFFFYEGKLYKIVTIKKWSDFTLKYAKENINNFRNVFLESHGEPDAAEEDEEHKIMTWVKEDLEITLEEFNLMSHKGLNKVLTLVYEDKNISPLAKKDETYELYKTKRKSTQYKK
ncbi:MAG: hypothetical protein ACE5KZ_11930 [Candidatus Scalinduaceae bacterium]